MIETILPRILQALWQGDRFVTAHPREEMDTGNAKIIDDLMQFQIDTDIQDLFIEMVRFFKTCLIQGTSVGKLTWDVLKDKPSFINKDILDFYPQPYKKNIADMSGVFDVFDMPIDILMDRERMGVKYTNLDKLKNTSMGTRDEEAKQIKDRVVGKMRNYDPKRKTALIYQYWGKVATEEQVDLDNHFATARYKEGLVEIANRQFIIRQGDNPYATPQNSSGFRPFISATDYLDPDEFWGIGDIEPIRDLQYEANEIENQTIDNIKLITNRMWKVGTTAGVD
ncbi:hypothetical protein LCGC14_3058890, partial [marine sediment metagenome]